MNCPKCATQLDGSARFCGACGTRLDGPSAGAGAQMASIPRPPASRPPPNALQMGMASTLPGGQSSPLGALGMGSAPADPFLGMILNNRYQIESRLGVGGFGAVYRGRQLAAGREVAIKVLHPEMARDPSLLARFRREGAVACSLRDPHTITTYDFDQTPEGTLYIAMELLQGRSVHDIFAEGALEWHRVFRVLEQMCSSLGEAHRQGIVHRDIKPENIYLEDRPGHPDFVKVLDFGIAKIVSGEAGQQQSVQLTATGQTLGTLEYMSPEQLMGKQLDGRSDIYAMGVLGHELMTGQLPFPDARGPAELIGAQLRKQPPMASSVRPDKGIPPAVDAVLLKMLEKDRTKRFADVDHLAVALQEALAGHGAHALRHADQALASSHTQRTTALPPELVGPPSAPISSPAIPIMPPVTGPPPPLVVAPPARSERRVWPWVVLVAMIAGGAAAAVLFTLLR
jgi:eukaryotic-like serine/threonine-protein kinase